LLAGCVCVVDVPVLTKRFGDFQNKQIPDFGFRIAERIFECICILVTGSVMNFKG